MIKVQRRSQKFFEEGVPTSVLSYQKQGSGGVSPQLLRDFQYFNESKLNKLLYFMQKSILIIMHINALGMKPVLDKTT